MNPIDTYRQVLKENEHSDYASQETINAHKDSHAAAVHNTPDDHDIAARSHDAAAEAHGKAAAMATSDAAREYHAHMFKHHNFLKQHHSDAFDNVGN